MKCRHGGEFLQIDVQGNTYCGVCGKSWVEVMDERKDEDSTSISK